MRHAPGEMPMRNPRSQDARTAPRWSRRRPLRTGVATVALVLGVAAGLAAPSGPARPVGAQVPVTPAPAVPATTTRSRQRRP